MIKKHIVTKQQHQDSRFKDDDASTPIGKLRFSLRSINNTSKTTLGSSNTNISTHTLHRERERERDKITNLDDIIRPLRYV